MPSPARCQPQTLSLYCKKVLLKVERGAAVEVLLLVGAMVAAFLVLGRTGLPDWASGADLVVATCSAVALSFAVARTTAVEGVAARTRRLSAFVSHVPSALVCIPHRSSPCTGSP